MKKKKTGLLVNAVITEMITILWGICGPGEKGNDCLGSEVLDAFFVEVYRLLGFPGAPIRREKYLTREMKAPL